MAAIGRYGPASAKELTSRTTVPPDKITRAVDQLVALGWASRRKDPADRRRVVLQLSKKGMKVYEDIEAVTRKLEQELRSALTVTEQRVFDELLGKLEQRANKILQR